MSTLVDLAAANELLVITLLSFTLCCLLLYKSRRRLSYILQELDYNISLIGRMARLVRRRNHNPDTTGWFPAELKVCADYYRFFRQHDVDRNFFNARRTYLDKVGELNRQPKPWYLWALIIILIFAEAYGFSYVLAMSPWAFASASLRDVPWLAGAVATLMAIIAVALTELAGEELYLNAAARRVRRDFAGHPNNRGIAFQPSHRVRLDDDQSVDDDQLHCIQTLNRLKRRPNEISYLMTFVAIVAIAGIASGSTYIRYKAFEHDLIQQQQLVEQQKRRDDAKVTVDQKKQLPDHLQKQLIDRDSKAQQDEQDTNVEGAWGSFVMLAFIFVALQIVAIMLGFKFGFAGQESKTAWRATHAFDGAQEYIDYHLNRRSEIMNQAQVRLADVQGRIRRWVERHPNDGDQIEAAKNAGHRTFAVYVSRIAPALGFTGQKRLQIQASEDGRVVPMGSAQS